MLTASSLLRYSHNPSEATMRNSSAGVSARTITVGSADMIGGLNGSGMRNLENNGSLLNSWYFMHKSPKDLVNCKCNSSQSEILIGSSIQFTLIRKTYKLQSIPVRG